MRAYKACTTGDEDMSILKVLIHSSNIAFVSKRHFRLSF
jgi:hypothetical protein